MPLWAMLIKSALRIILSASYVTKSITSISHLRWLSPFGALRHHLPPAERWDNKDSQSNPFISCTTISTGCSATACGGSPAKRAKGGGSRYTSKARLACFPTPAGRLYGFIQTGAFYNLEAPYNNPRARGASNLSPLRTFGPSGPSTLKPHRASGRLYGFRRQRRYKKRRRRRRTSPAQRYYITPEGESPEPACKASADHR